MQPAETALKDPESLPEEIQFTPRILALMGLTVAALLLVINQLFNILSLIHI